MLGETILFLGGTMAVRDALLALLTVGPAYGFALHGGLAVRTGGRRSVNVGQTYATLERLTKQGLVEPAGSTDDGLPLHRLTATGLQSAHAWLNGVDAASADPWDETTDRVLIARSLPGWDAAATIEHERGRWSERQVAAAALAAADTSDAAEEPARSDGRAGDDAAAGSTAEAGLARLAASAELVRSEAMLEWLETANRAGDLALEARADRPRRGRRPTAASTSTSPDAQASASA